MFRLVTLSCLLTASLWLTGCSSGGQSRHADETVSVSGVKLIFTKSLPDEFFVRSTGTGANQEEAVKNALLSAVQQTMGVLVVSELSIANNQVLQDIYAGYSSGTVKSFNILGCVRGDRISCTVDAITKPWAIREQIFASGKAVRVDGQSLYGQYITQREVLLQRRKLMDYYLSRVRTIGLVPTIRSISTVPSASERAIVKVQFGIAWNKPFREELIQFLKQLEKDTGGNAIRRTPGYSDAIMAQEVYNQNFSNIVISWGPRSGQWFADEVVIRSPDPELYKLVRKYLYEPISIGVDPFGVCDFFQPDASILRFASPKPHELEFTLHVRPEDLARVNTISMIMGCNKKPF